MQKYLLITSILLITSTIYGQNENPKSGRLSIDFVNGISMPNGGFEDFAKDGFNSEISLSKSFCEKLSIGFGAKHSSFNVRQEFGAVQGSRNQFTSTTFDMGPQFSLGSKKFAIELYGRTGLSVNSTPEIKMLQANTDITIGKMDQQSMKALSARLGAKIKTELCTGLQLFVSSEYVTTLNSDMNFYSKDLSKAIDAEGRIDPDLAGEIPFSTESLNFSSLNVNFGVSIALGSCCSGKSSKRSSNPLYQGNGKAVDNPMFQKNSRGVNPMYQESGKQGENPMFEGAIDGGNTGGSSGTRARDHNASRSNTSSSIQPDNNGGNGNEGGTKATDYNSSRSNRTTSSSVMNNEGENGNNSGNNRGVEATDYNSSRSNKQGVADSSGDDGNNDGTSGTKATDYNSSRSNRTTSSSVMNNDTGNGSQGNSTRAQDHNASRSNTSSSIQPDNNGGNENEGGTKATDYNSSRSNRTTSSAIDNNTDNGNSGGTKATDYNSSRSNRTTSSAMDNNVDNGNNGGNRATDYNSSRSNKQGVADTNDDIRVSMTQADKRKMIKKLKREERARVKKENKQLKEEQKKRKMQANSIY